MTLPLDPQSLADIAAAQQQRDTALTNYGTERTIAAKQYGYTPTYDANGYVQALALDPNNPYAKAGLLKQSYDNRLRSTKQNFASRGQLYAGSYGVASSLEDQNYAQGSSNLQNAFINFIARNQGQIAGANSKYTTDVGSAYAGAATRAAQNDTGQGGDTGDGGGPAPAAGPVGYSVPTGLVNGKYIDSQGGVHATQKKNGKNYYLNSNGGWTPF